MLLSAGDRVDRYQIVGLLGSGGMGEVYRALDPKLERHIALKIVHLGTNATDGGARLLREARAAATLSHPNVLAVYDLGEVSEPEALRGLAYIAMELVVGSSLRAYVGAASVPVEERIGWLRDVARALGAAHEAGVVHRDVKPENVMIRFDGIVKVLDFGIARRALVAHADESSSTDAHSLPTIDAQDVAALAPSLAASLETHGLTGTLLYMAPEQLRGEALDGRADQFAWGVTAYELLTGELPWTRGTDSIAIVSQILSREARAPAEIDPRIPQVVSDGVLRALAKAPSDRFPSMADVLAMLERVAPGASSAHSAPEAAGDPPSSVHATLPSASPAAKALRRRGGRVLGAVAFVALGGALVGGLRSIGAPKAAPAPATAADVEACTSSAACSRAHGGAAWRCHSARHECVPIASVDCKVLSEPTDLANDETVWLGALYPTTGPEAAQFASESNAIELAREDFAAALGGSATTASSMRARPIAVAMCDETADPMRAARHLAEDLEVPATIGFRGAQVARSIIPAVFLPNHVLSFVSISWASDLMSIPEPEGQPRLLWRSTLDTAAAAPALAALVSDVLEPRLRAVPRALRDGVVRVAVVRPSNGSVELSDLLLRETRFNGKSALENGDDFRQYVYDAGDGGTGAVVDAIASFAPNVVFIQGAAVARDVVVPLESRWKSASRPYYVCNSNFAVADITKLAAHGPDVRHRFFGLTNATARLPNAALALHYNLAFPREEPIARASAPQPSYDAFYVLADAVYALGDGPVTGPALSTAMARLVAPGKPIDVGTRGIFDAFTTLRSGGRIDLNGALGSLDFDPETGEAPVDYAILCLELEDRGAVEVESGLVYDSRAKKLIGTMRCR